MKTNIILIAIFFSLFSCKKEVKTISVKALKAVLIKNEMQLIDVRTPEEYAQGHIKNAKLIDVTLEGFAKIAADKLDKTVPVYVYCKMGGRGARAAKILQKKGFEVYNLKGGYSAWKIKTSLK